MTMNQRTGGAAMTANGAVAFDWQAEQGLQHGRIDLWDAEDTQIDVLPVAARWPDATPHEVMASEPTIRCAVPPPPTVTRPLSCGLLPEEHQELVRDQLLRETELELLGTTADGSRVYEHTCGRLVRWRATSPAYRSRPQTDPPDDSAPTWPCGWTTYFAAVRRGDHARAEQLRAELERTGGAGPR